MGEDEKIVQILALRRQQRGVDGTRRPDVVHVVGDQPLQELDAILAADREQAAIVEDGKSGLARHRSPFAPANTATVWQN